MPFKRRLVKELRFHEYSASITFLLGFYLMNWLRESKMLPDNYQHEAGITKTLGAKAQPSCQGCVYVFSQLFLV